jgi:hypothetical protein
VTFFVSAETGKNEIIGTVPILLTFDFSTNFHSCATGLQSPKMVLSLRSTETCHCVSSSPHMAVRCHSLRRFQYKCANISNLYMKNVSNESRVAMRGVGGSRCSLTVKAAAMEDVFGDDVLSLDELKSLLDDTLWGTGRGLSANSDIRAEITDLVSQLEAKTPIAEPNQALDSLAGEWKLVYTSNSELIPVLALGKLPLVEVGDITQRIDAGSGKVENKVEFTVPFSKTSIGSTATFDVRSPKLLEIEFTDGKISTPELMSDFELPDSVEIAGQTVELTMLKTALQPLDGPVRSAIEQAGMFLAGQPDFTFKTPRPMNGKSRATWLLNTYLDDDLRIARGDGGSLFIMKKSPLLELPEKIEIDEIDTPEPMQPVDISPAPGTDDVSPPEEAKTELDQLCEDDPSAEECRVYED